MNLSIVLLLNLLMLISGCQTWKASQLPPKDEPQSSSGATDLVAVEKNAEAAYRAQDWATSERLYVELTKATPAATEPWFRLGNIYARTGRIELAVKAYRETVIRDTKHTRAWHNMGVVQLRQAAQSFGELQKYAAPDDPLGGRGKALGDAIDKLLAPTDPDATP